MAYSKIITDISSDRHIACDRQCGHDATIRVQYPLKNCATGICFYLCDPCLNDDLTPNPDKIGE